MENVAAFLTDLAEVLEEDGEVDSDYVLTEEKWDSLAQIATIALIDEHFDATVGGNDLEDAKTVGQILQIVEQRKGT